MAREQIYQKYLLSGSTNGLGIPVIQTATPGTLIHTAVTGTAAFDELWIWAYNTTSSNIIVTLEWGDAVTTHNILTSISPSQYPPQQLVGVMGGGGSFLLQNGLTLKAFAPGAGVTIYGFVNRISPG
jgi:hypothetical protein